jgi:tRNA pseudouridine55 synthase
LQLNGLLLIDKPQDLTSHDVVARVRKILGQKSVGHTGTLDPLATGLMVLVLGEATKLSDYLIAADKSYRAKIRLGVRTDTLDRTGKILNETPCALASDQINDAVASLEGEFEWQIPLFSAAKIEGKKLYEYGRNQEDVERPYKLMSFSEAKVLEVGPAHVEVELNCSKGSFIRSWAAELGESLKVGGVIDELRRLSVGAWHVDSALTLAALEQHPQELGAAFIPMGQALPGLKSVIAGPKEVRLVMHGQIPKDLTARLIFEQKQAISAGLPVYIKVLTAPGELLAILAAEPGQGLKIRRVFRPSTEGFT